MASPQEQPPASTPSRSVELLARNVANATYAGEKERKCMHLTSLCPDECNHANKWAMFDITTYLEYDKPGEYGDEKQTTFAVQLRPAERGVAHAAGTFELLSTLAVGDQVRLEWVHEYVTERDEQGRGTSYPIRRVLQLEKRE